MDVEMNLRMITKNHAAVSKIRSSLKIDFRVHTDSQGVKKIEEPVRDTI